MTMMLDAGDRRGLLVGLPYCCSAGLTLATVVGEPHCCSVVTVNTSNTDQLPTLNSSIRRRRRETGPGGGGGGGGLEEEHRICSISSSNEPLFENLKLLRPVPPDSLSSSFAPAGCPNRTAFCHPLRRRWRARAGMGGRVRAARNRACAGWSPSPPPPSPPPTPPRASSTNSA